MQTQRAVIEINNKTKIITFSLFYANDYYLLKSAISKKKSDYFK